MHRSLINKSNTDHLIPFKDGLTKYHTDKPFIVIVLLVIEAKSEGIFVFNDRTSTTIAI